MRCIHRYTCLDLTFYSILSFYNTSLFFQIDNMKLIYNNVTRTTRNQDGVDIRIPGWGDPFVVEYLDPSKASPGSYFKDIGNMLVDQLQYSRNYSVRGAPYDFRKAPSMYIL